MPFVPPGYAQANFRMRLVGDVDEMMVTLGIKYDTVVLGDLDGVANDLFATFHTNWKAMTVNFYGFTGVTLYSDIAGAKHVNMSTAAEVAGTVAGGGLTQNCAWLVKKKSALGGRNNRGRLYIPGLPENWVTNHGS